MAIQGALNRSSVVWLPRGVYAVSKPLHVPSGSALVNDHPARFTTTLRQPICHTGTHHSLQPQFNPTPFIYAFVLTITSIESYALSVPDTLYAPHQVGMARHLSRIVPTRDFNFKNKHDADDLATRNASELSSPRNASELSSPVALGGTCSPVQTPPFTRASPLFCTRPFE